MSNPAGRSMKLLLSILVPFLSLFVVVGLGFAGYGAYNWFKVKEVRTQWATTQGQVLSSRLTHDEDTTGTSIRYQYTVAGRQFESDNVRAGGDFSSSDSSEAAAIVDRYPAGGTCTVYYNPADPSQSVLVAETNMFMVVFLGVGLSFSCMPFMALAGVLRAMFGLRRLARAPRLLAAAGAGGCHIGQVTVASGRGQFRVAQRPHPVAGAVGGAGLAAFLSVFVTIFLLSDRSADERMRVMLWAVGGGFLAGFCLSAAWRSVVFDARLGTLTRTVTRLGWASSRSWPLAEIKELAIAPTAQSRGANVVQALALKLQPAAGPPVMLLSERFGDQTVMLAGAMLARNMDRRLAVHESVKIESASAALEAIEAMDLKDVLVVDHAAADPSAKLPAQMPAWMRQVGSRIERAAEALGVPVDELKRRNEPPPAASLTGDPLAQGRPAAEALATEGLFSHVGNFFRAIVPTLFGLVFAAAGLFFMVLICVLPAVETLRAVTWPTTTGRVAEVARKNVTDDSGGNDTYRPLVRYTYSVAGKQYEHDSPFLHDTSSSATGWIEPVLARYRPGQDVVVHYDPADPAHSALELRVPGMTIGVLGFTSIFVLVGLSVAAWPVRGLRLRRQFARLLAGGAPLAGRLGRFRFEQRGDELIIVWRPSRLMPALATWVALATVLGIAMLLLAPGAAMEMAVAWGLPLAAALAVVWYGRGVQRRLSIVGIGARRTVQWFRQGWLREPDLAEWPAENVEVVHVHAERHETSGDSGRRVYYKPELKLILSQGDAAPLLECDNNAPVIASAAAALARSLGLPLWISHNLDDNDQAALRRALDAQGHMDMARVIGDLPDTSWDERLGPERKAQ
jgi:hypothetical protein